MIDQKLIEEIVRDYFYPGPVAGSTERLAKALNELVSDVVSRSERVEAERDYAVSEMKNAQAYWRIETRHAEQAEAERDEALARNANYINQAEVK